MTITQKFYTKNVKFNVLDPDTILIRDRIAGSAGGYSLSSDSLMLLDTFVKNLKIITGGVWNEELGYTIGGSLPLLWFHPQISVAPTGTTTKVFNLGTSGTLGEGTMLNGNSTNMIAVVDNKKRFAFASASSQAITIPYNAGIGFSGNDKFFNFAFVRPSTFPVESRIFAQSTEIITRYANSDKKAEIVLNSLTTNDRTKSTSLLVANNWYGLAFYYDGVNIKVHFNGVKEGELATTGTYGGNTSVYSISNAATTTAIDGYLGSHLIFKNLTITDEMATKINSLFSNR